MAKYRVRPGYTYGAYGTFREGDIVELPELDAAPFLDKLELVPNEAPSTPEPDLTPEAEAEPVPEADAGDLSEQGDVVEVEVPEQPAEVVKKPGRKRV